MKHVIIAAVLSTLTVPGCKVHDAPSNLEDVMVFGFQRFDDSGDRALADMFDELMPLTVEFEAELVGGYRVSNLTAADLEGAGVEDPQVEEIFGAMGSAIYRNKLVPVLGAATLPNKADAFDHIISYSILEDTDRDCFLAAQCESYSVTFQQTAKVTLLGEATQTMTQQYRWVTSNDGVDFVVVRALAPDPMSFSTNIASVFQQYSLAVMHPHGSGARRIEAYWVDSRVVGASVPDYFAVDSAVKAFGAQAERIDDFIEGGGNTNK